MERVGVGVVGCGAIAQMMHLRYLKELGDRFRMVALADISPKLVDYVGDYYGVEQRFTDYRGLLDCPGVEAVVLLTNGTHTGMVIDSLRAGKHVLVEKPLCYSVAEADAVVEAASKSRNKVLLGYSVAFDPAFQHCLRLLKGWAGLDYVAAHVLHPADELYWSHQGVKRFDDAPPPVAGGVRAEVEGIITESLGRGAAAAARRAYYTLLESSIHDVYCLRLALGGPAAVISAETWNEGRDIAVTLRYPDGVRVQYAWVFNHELKHFHQEYLFVGGANRMRIQWPSPFLRSAPTILWLDSMNGDALEERRVTSSYEESFKLEQMHFHDCITRGVAPLHTVEHARDDTRLLEQIAAAIAAGASA